MIASIIFTDVPLLSLIVFLFCPSAWRRRTIGKVYWINAKEGWKAL